MALAAPFTGKPAEVMKVQHRFSGFAWLPEKDHALCTEFDRDRRWRTTALVDLGQPEESRKVLFDLSINDAYKDPGTPSPSRGPTATPPSSRTETRSISPARAPHRRARGRSWTRWTSRPARRPACFSAASEAYEMPLGFVGDSRSTILISHESKTEPPNEYTVDLASGKRTKLTDYRDPARSSRGSRRS